MVIAVGAELWLAVGLAVRAKLFLPVGIAVSVELHSGITVGAI